jgi:phage-related protein
VRFASWKSASLPQFFRESTQEIVVGLHHMIPAKFWRKLSDQKLWEVRAEYVGNIYRILATTAKDNRVILLHGFQKKSQKTPRQDMEIVQQRQKRYFQRHGYL